MEKLNYEEFKKVVEQQFTAWLPEEYKKCKVGIQPRYKVNTVLDYINLYDGNGKGMNGPSFCATEMYQKYCDGLDLDTMLLEVGKYYANMEEENSIATNFVKNVNGKDSLLEKVVIQVINREKNQKLLETIPHVNIFKDLAVIFRIFIDEYKGEVISSILTNEMAKAYDIESPSSDYTEVKSMLKNELFAHAYENTDNLFTVKIHPLLQELPFFAVTNNLYSWGANLLLYPQTFKRIAQKLDSELYIFPSSIHELVVVKKEVDDNDSYFKNMVKEINDTTVQPGDILTDHIFIYRSGTIVEL